MFILTILWHIWCHFMWQYCNLITTHLFVRWIVLWTLGSSWLEFGPKLISGDHPLRNYFDPCFVGGGLQIYMTETCYLKLNIKLISHHHYKMSPAKRICVFEHSVMTNFNCACPAIQRDQGSSFLSEGSSWLTAFMSEQRRFWRDCADAQARLNLRCSHRR